MEHVDFATDGDGNYDDFEELGDTDTRVISRVSIRDIHEDDTQSTEVAIFLIVRKLGDIVSKVIFVISIRKFSDKWNMSSIEWNR